MFSDSNDSSYIKMTSEEVIERCNETIDDIKWIRKREDRRIVAKEIACRKKWIKRLPFLKWIMSTNRRDIEKEFKGDIYKSYPSIYGYGTYGIARKCRAMARRSDGHMFVSREDFADLFKDDVDE